MSAIAFIYEPTQMATGQSFGYFLQGFFFYSLSLIAAVADELYTPIALLLLCPSRCLSHLSLHLHLYSVSLNSIVVNSLSLLLGKTLHVFTDAIIADQ